jgi:uncharacterized protein (TIGR01777 family)
MKRPPLRAGQPSVCYPEQRIESAARRLAWAGWGGKEQPQGRNRSLIAAAPPPSALRRGFAMRILITGSSGLIGSALALFLSEHGHAVVRLVRSQPRKREEEVHWDPAAGRLDPTDLQGLDAVVHLAGENISQRWTREKKVRIRDSRVKGTRLLAESLARLSRPPAVLVSASAVGYYGDCGDQVLREESPSGRGFLSEVCREWEAATEPAARKGIRVVNLRTGVVLSARGGALARMLLPFRLGLGGRIGTGKQYLSWIALDDLVGVIVHALTHDALQGPVNAVSPNPVTNLEFTKILGRVLHRPTLFAIPAFALRLVFGRMVDELLLASARVEPARLLESGYVFRYPELEGALRYLLGK